MAVDTREKRFSMLAMGSGLDGCGIHTLFEADGTVDNDDRQHLLDCYSGIAFSGAAPPSAADTIFAHYRMKLMAGGVVGGTA